MSTHLTLLVAYSVLLVVLGVWIGRRVTTSDGFFVAGRALGPGLLFSTMLAANIGAGSTVGAAGLGYQYGMAAWWWVGAAAIGSVVQAFWIGPKMRDLAEQRGFRTVGDFLEQRYSLGVRASVTAMLWVGSLAILAGQLIAMSTLLTAMTGSPKWLGCLLGGIVMTVYFAAGGLLSSAWVNLVQLAVLFAGFAVAVPIAISGAGGWSQVVARVNADPGYWSFTQNGPAGLTYLALLAPAFIVSPGLLQKIFGARDGRAVRIGVGANAAVLFAFAFLPPILGVVARSLHPELAKPELALPTLLVQDVPVAIGSLGLAALFSAEVSTADAILFMLATSLSQDLYRRLIRPNATDAQVLRVARWAAVLGGALGVALALVAQTIVGTLSLFYSVLGVSLFVPVVAGLTVRRFGVVEAVAAIVGGVVILAGVHLSTGGKGYGWVSPSLAGLVMAVTGAMVVYFVRRGAASPAADST